MIRQEFFRWPGLFLIRNPYIGNIMFACIFICVALLTYKIYYTQDGEFRRHLLWYFGTMAFWAFWCIIFYHPFFNVWLPLALAIPNLVALLRFTLYVTTRLGLGRRKTHRLPPAYK